MKIDNNIIFELKGYSKFCLRYLIKLILLAFICLYVNIASANMLIVAPLKVKVTEDIYLEIPTPIESLTFLSQKFMERELDFNYRLYTVSDRFSFGFDNVNKTDVDCIRSKSCFQYKLSSSVSDVIVDEKKYTDKSESVKCRHTLPDIIKGNRYICYESYAYTDDKISYIIESQYHC
ncbi:hypothetical protein N7931_19250, partial [Catenovulum sp. 2E275]|uniref:hypothetical protein n=1 Tax=Catenovulum sp. 2E275 TaxID=2980497 RepID=UPI0021D16DE1